jgi:hypothetical protein
MHPIELLAAHNTTPDSLDQYHALQHHFAVKNERRLARLERRRHRPPRRLPRLRVFGRAAAPAIRARVDLA